MVYAVISDIHANATALRKVMDDAWKQGATHIVCLGDVVGYGPEPARSVTMLRIEKATVIAGNHDDAVSGRADATDFTDFAADAVGRHRMALRDDEKEWLGALPYIANLEGDAVGVHGDLTAPRDFRYIESTADAAANFAVCANPLIFVGHTHVPCLFVTGKSGKIYKTAPQDFTLEQGKRYIVNVGTVGYPREDNGTCLSSYVIYDSARGEVRYRFLPFSVASVMQRGRATETPRAAAPSAAPPSASSAPSRPVPDAAARRERRIAILAGIAIVVVFVVALGVAMSTRKKPQAPAVSQAVKTVEEASPASPDPSKQVSQVLYVNGRKKFVRANVHLAKNSSPAILTANFLSQAGAILSSKREMFAHKKTAKLPIPSGTHRVEFIVEPAKRGDTISISKFEPTAE